MSRTHFWPAGFLTSHPTTDAYTRTCLFTSDGVWLCSGWRCKETWGVCVVVFSSAANTREMGCATQPVTTNSLSILSIKHGMACLVSETLRKQGQRFRYRPCGGLHPPYFVLVHEAGHGQRSVSSRFRLPKPHLNEPIDHLTSTNMQVHLPQPRRYRPA